MSVTVAAGEVAAYLARHRPPTYRDVTVEVGPHRETGPAAHELVVAAALSEQLTLWPKGTALTIDYRPSGYAQALAYPPSILTEIGPLTTVQLTLAVARGWMNPKPVPPNHPDFESQPVWADNPVREWCHPPDGIPDMAAFLVDGVRTVLGRDPGAGFRLSLFNDHDDDDGEDQELVAAASLTVPVGVPDAATVG